jgi:ketosteroid isomerase-like protein
MVPAARAALGEERDMSEQNVAVVREAYAAFGRGDVDGILDRCSDNVVWEGVIGANANVPQSGIRHGKDQVREFFRQVAESATFVRFEPKEFVAQGDRVVVLGSYAATVTSTGRSTESDWVMVFRLVDGRISEFREFTDSAQLNAAYEPRAMGASARG